MSRRFTIEIQDDLSDDHYAALTNALWMLLRVTRYEFRIVPDDHTLLEVLNGAWDSTGGMPIGTDRTDSVEQQSAHAPAANRGDYPQGTGGA